jgi:hypothetical protein
LIENVGPKLGDDLAQLAYAADHLARERRRSRFTAMRGVCVTINAPTIDPIAVAEEARW